MKKKKFLTCFCIRISLVYQYLYWCHTSPFKVKVKFGIPLSGNHKEFVTKMLTFFIFHHLLNCRDEINEKLIFVYFEINITHDNSINLKNFFKTLKETFCSESVSFFKFLTYTHTYCT